MRTSVRSTLLLLSATLACARGPQAPQPGPQPRLELLPCDDVAPGARCGTLPVPENRSRPGGRTIGIGVVVVPAKGAERAADPVVFLAGGPGDSATAAAAGLAAALAPLLAQRDLLLVDQRGTGRSHPLAFDSFGEGRGLQRFLGEFMPAAAACAAAERLARDADLTQYTTPIAMDDLEDVRAALGYEELNLVGGSYGTRAAMAYLRQHPGSVRSVVLYGVSRFDDHLPRHSAQNVDRSLAGVLGECQADARCQAAFPGLTDEIRAVFARLEAAPAAAQVVSAETGEPERVLLSRELAAEALRYMLYTPAGAGSLPVVMHQAASGDFGPLAEMAVFARMNIVGRVSLGQFLAVLCTEDVPNIPPEAEARAEGTVSGPARLRQLRAACACWPEGALPAGYHEPVRSEAPVLIVTGALDPATPPANGDYVARTLPNALHLVVPHGGHEIAGLENASCVDDLVTRFVDRGTARGLDTSCLATIRRPPFPTAPLATAVVALAPAELERFTGPWVGVAQPFEIGIAVAGSHLEAALPGGRKLLLLPVSPTLFKVVGPPGAYLRFEVKDGRAGRAVLEEGGHPALELVRRER